MQWDKVRLQSRETEGAFTFQAALYRNGTIVFGYRDVSSAVRIPKARQILESQEAMKKTCKNSWQQNLRVLHQEHKYKPEKFQVQSKTKNQV